MRQIPCSARCIALLVGAHIGIDVIETRRVTQYIDTCRELGTYLRYCSPDNPNSIVSMLKKVVTEDQAHYGAVINGIDTRIDVDRIEGDMIDALYAYDILKSR